MEIIFALLALAINVVGILVTLRRIKQLKTQIAELEAPPPVELSGSYRTAPATPPDQPSAFSELVHMTHELIADPKGSQGRKYIDHKGKLPKCPVCDGFVHVSDPVFFPAGCSDQDCGLRFSHLHQKCGCGAFWATASKEID
jgi:hypothetical protein